MQEGGQTAVAANGDVVPAYKLRDGEQRIRELERALGRKTMENEFVENGFEMKALHSDVAGAAFGVESPEFAVVGVRS